MLQATIAGFRAKKVCLYNYQKSCIKVLFTAKLVLYSKIAKPRGVACKESKSLIVGFQLTEL